MNHQPFIPSQHSDWIKPHSFAWYAQIGKLTGKYVYPWNSSIVGQDAEELFEQEVAAMVAGKRVLDIGCGDGEFALQWSPIAEQVTGVDVTEDFIAHGDAGIRRNVRFVTANTKEALPFADESFDCAYNRRGPTSAYLDIARVLRPGGRLISLHPGDGQGSRLHELMPHLFSPPFEGTPILDNMKERLAAGGLGHAEIETVHATQYLHEPIDVIRMCCFGQLPAVHVAAIAEALPEIQQVFAEHAAAEGLAFEAVHYIVRVSKR
ncbi:class I SAM-dependent methyltransferase [Paenibacillus sp. HB172176]|uniref:class I SAM-dependent methyltransferase n=1 Tax=Paenibacillus sp. HB172176 TaxID=2493690 RepID=UPI00143BFD9D|nr:class I SAM-dependent methyltransferase [Paenibacillus sp. HB172176]